MKKEIRQEIVGSGEKVRRNTNYNQEKLEDLLTAIISRTSKGADIKFKNEVSDYTDSSKVNKIIKIKVGKYNPSFSKVSIKIQLPEHNEIWTIDVKFTKQIQGGDRLLFHKEIKKASKLVIEEEIRKTAEPVLGKGKEVGDHSTSAPGAKITGVDMKGANRSKPKRKTKTRTAVSKVITDDMTGAFFEKWIEKHGPGKIFQREFLRIVSEVLTFEINYQSLMKFLEKKGVVLVTRIIENKPQVEMTEAGKNLMEKYIKREEDKREEKEDVERFEKFLDLLDDARPSLEQLVGFQSVEDDLNEVGLEEKNVRKEILGLQRKLAEKEKRLAKILAKKDSIYSEIQEIIHVGGSKNIKILLKVLKELGL